MGSSVAKQASEEQAGSEGSQAESLKDCNLSALCFLIEDLCAAVQRGDLAACQRLAESLGTASSSSVPRVIDELASGGLAALHVAAACGRADIVRFLVDLQADVNVRDSKQHTPLHCASRALLHPNCTACVRELLCHNADPFCATELGSLDVHERHPIGFSMANQKRGGLSQANLPLVLEYRHMESMLSC